MRAKDAFGAINNALTNLWTQGLPDDYYQQYTKAVAAVTKDDALRVAIDVALSGWTRPKGKGRASRSSFPPPESS